MSEKRWGVIGCCWHNRMSDQDAETGPTCDSTYKPIHDRREQFVAMKFLLLFAISLFSQLKNILCVLLLLFAPSLEPKILPTISCVAGNLFCNSKRLITSHTLFRFFYSIFSLPLSLSVWMSTHILI